MKSQPFRLRLSPALEAMVTEAAPHTRRSKGAVVEALAEEALKTRMFPGIAFRGVDWERRAWVIGDVWAIVAAYQDFGSVDAMAKKTALTDRQIRLALAYLRTVPGRDRRRHWWDAAVDRRVARPVPDYRHPVRLRPLSTGAVVP